jgi:predicted flap endonuclease-1-like 5' DNA nuclease
MAYKVIDIEGIGAVYAGKLNAAGIKTTDELLTACATPAGRKGMAEKTGLDTSRILKWANMADLMRIKGVSEEYSELLEAAGVDTVKELRNRNPENLTAAMAAANEKRKLVRRLPSTSEVTRWVTEAKELKPVLTY